MPVQFPPPPSAPVVKQPSASAVSTPAAVATGHPSLSTGPTPAADVFSKPSSGPKGAYYRKVLSGSSAQLSGIATTGILPTPTFDPARQTANGPKDIPDVYVGGTSSKGGEIDCGLSWDRVHDDSGRALSTDLAGGTDGGNLDHQFHQVGQTWVDGNGKKLEATDPRLKQLKPDFAYHPYFRTDLAGKNTWGNRDATDKKLTYLYPGQRFSMQLKVSDAGKAQLDISSPNGTAYSAHFDAPGFGGGAARQFKRIISIDQVGNEGKPVAKTSSTLTNGGWNTVALTKFDGSKTALTPAHGKLIAGTDQLSNYAHIFTVSKVNDSGGEWVSITPPRK